MLKQPLHTEELGPNPSATSSDLQIVAGNPFPGLRSFSIDESFLFFGREGQIDEILLKISQNHFVTVMGYSGSGKSSLMYCGLVPVLYGGFMSASSPNWQVIFSRPGTSPLNSLTDSIVEYLISVGRVARPDFQVHHAIINSILRSGSNGLVEVARYLQLQADENIFFLVDQFEEIFRFRDEAGSSKADLENEAQLYVRLILTAVQQKEVPVYVALTMRSDFIGQCSVFTGLTEVINNSNYLVPQLTRDQKRTAIEGPIAVAGGKITERLVKRLLSDMGNNQDQLPIMQHALMRTWDYWVSNREPGESIDVRHYNAIGKIDQALSLHANETYDELSTRDKEIAEVLFKNITEKNQDNRGLRRPCRLGLVAELAEASEDEVIYVVEHFRRSGRSFLMPPAQVKLTVDSMIELSHESLMRIWNRLAGWVEDEFESASMYKRLSEAAAMYQIGKTGLWRPPDLQLALNWQKKQKPNREWAQRYDETFERAIVFLDTSRITYEAELKNQEMMQRRVLQRTRATAIILGVAFLVAILFFLFAYLQKLQADSDKLIAEERRIEAIELSKKAAESQKEAEKKTKESEARRLELLATNDYIIETLKKLTIEKNKTEAALIKARLEEEKALAANEQEKVAKEEAQLNLETAELNYKLANSLFMLTKAQELASKASVQVDDKDLAGLLAMQGYHYHQRYSGKKYDPYIYNGLYTALRKIEGASYNSMKIDGPPRVHMRSLKVSAKAETFFVAGADGRVYQGNYDKLTNKATHIETPYPIKTIAINKDETYLINGSDSSSIQIHSLTANAKPKIIKGFDGGINDIEFLMDNSGVIISGKNKKLSWVNHLNGNTKILLTLPYELKAISLSEDGNWLVGAAWSGQVILINLKSYEATTLVDESANGIRILSVEFSPSGAYLAYGGEDVKNKRGIVRLYHLQSKETRQFTGHKAGVYDLEFSPDEKLLASAGADKRLQLYVLEFPDDLPVVMENNNGFIWDIEFAKGSDYLIAACSESEIRIWPTDPSLLAQQICPKLKRNMTQDEWNKFVGIGEEVPYEYTCVRALIKEN